jgi:hypothetical protein
MLEFLRGKAFDRKMRLFAVACCRRIWDQLKDERSRRAIETIEHYLDGRAHHEVLRAAYEAAASAGIATFSTYFESAHIAVEIALEPSSDDIVQTAYATASSAADAIALEVRRDHRHSRKSENSDHYSIEQGKQAALARDIFGDPFRAETISLSWRTTSVTNLAQALYEHRQLPSGLFDNQRLGVLADALEEAGCDNADILGHLRGGGDHVRGCWVIDLLTGRE